MQAEGGDSLLLQDSQRLFQLRKGHAVLCFSRIAHDGISDGKLSARIIAQAYTGRKSSVRPQEIDVRQVIQIDICPQRTGLGIASFRPLFVVRVEPRENRVVVGYEEELFHKTVTAGDVNLISVEKIDKPMRITAKIRYGQKEQPGVAEMTDDGRLKVVFDEAQRAPARGQALVMYDGDIVVGGGVID